jgi:hypothetical protein
MAKHMHPIGLDVRCIVLKRAEVIAAGNSTRPPYAVDARL